MHPENVRKHLKKSPFQAFRIHMSDGSSYDVPHPDFAFVTRTEVLVGIPADGDDLPERSVFCDPLHITQIEPLPPKRRRRRAQQ
jgi:hypothetical protein